MRLLLPLWEMHSHLICVSCLSTHEATSATGAGLLLALVQALFVDLHPLHLSPGLGCQTSQVNQQAGVFILQA